MDKIVVRCTLGIYLTKSSTERIREYRKEFLSFFLSMSKERRFRNMVIVCFGGFFAALFLLAWTLCRAAGWEKEREDLEQEKYLKEWQEKKLKKSKKIEN